MKSHGNESTEVQLTQKIGKEIGNSYRKNEEMDVFHYQKRVNVREHTVKIAPLGSFGKLPPESPTLVAIFQNSPVVTCLPCVHIHLLF